MYMSSVIKPQPSKKTQDLFERGGKGRKGRESVLLVVSFPLFTTSPKETLSVLRQPLSLLLSRNLLAMTEYLLSKLSIGIRYLLFECNLLAGDFKPVLQSLQSAFESVFQMPIYGERTTEVHIVHILFTHQIPLIITSPKLLNK